MTEASNPRGKRKDPRTVRPRKKTGRSFTNDQLRDQLIQAGLYTPQGPTIGEVKKQKETESGEVPEGTDS